ncbi:hypothetical protein ABIA35_003362 [Catenulispora sp. MAP12-49]|uniref:hypothetical protein n=1 Tax=Catenulispora sp. MAP12-49 TaxID=3156302 RepID=UPI003512B303
MSGEVRLGEGGAEVAVEGVGDAAAESEAAAGGDKAVAGEESAAGPAEPAAGKESAASPEEPAVDDETAAVPGEPAADSERPAVGEMTTVGAVAMAGPEAAAVADGMPATAHVPTGNPTRRRGLFVAGWLVSALAVGAVAGFGILAAIGPSKDAATASVPVAPPTTPSPSVTSGVRPDGTHYGSVRDFLLPVPDGYKPGPDEGGLGNDAAIPPDQADPTVALLFGALPASDMTSAQGAITNGHMSDGAVRTYQNEAGTLDVAVTVLRLDPAQSAESSSEFERVVKQSRAFRTGPQVPGHPDALCVLPVTHVGDPLDSMTCLATVGDTLAIVNAEGTVPLDTNAVTELFGRQLDTLKGGLGT